MTQTSYRVSLQHRGQAVVISVQPDQFILDAALDQGIDLPSSCRSGVCMTCAARVLQGEIEQEEAMGISSQLQQEGYVLLCVAHACSDLEIATHKEDEVYERQFGAEKRL